MAKVFSVFVLVGLVALPLPAAAQDGSLSTLVPNLILRGITLPGGDAPGNPHAGHFTLGNPTTGGLQATSQVDQASIDAVVNFGNSLRSQFANFPLGSSSGGFTYRFDSSTGTYSRSSTSFGPAFTERSLTIGRGQVSLGFNYQHTSFDTFGGLDLQGNEINFYLRHTDCCGGAAPPPPSANNPGFEGDLLQTSLDLKATTDTFALFANFGVTNNFDIGVAIPISRVDLEANVHATIIRLSSAGNPTVHTFTQGADDIDADFPGSGSATGIGDILVRARYNIVQRGAQGMAAAVDLRLPTGNEDDLLGLGTTQAKIFFIASSGNDRFSPHVNVGYTISGNGPTDAAFGVAPLAISDEFNWAGGVEFVAHPRLTLIGDIIGRTLLDAGKLEAEDQSFVYRATTGASDAFPNQTSTTNPLTQQPYRQLGLLPGNLNLVLGAAGFKFNAATNLLVSANLLFPLTDGGLRDTLAFTFGLDYAF